MKLSTAYSPLAKGNLASTKPILPEQPDPSHQGDGFSASGLALAGVGALSLLTPMVQAAPAVQTNVVISAERLEQEEQTLLAKLKASGQALEPSKPGLVGMELGDGGYYTQAYVWGNPSGANPWVNLNIYEWNGDDRTTTVHVEYRERADESGWRFLERTLGEGDSLSDARQQTVVNLGNHRVINHFVSTQGELSGQARQTLQEWKLSYESPAKD